MLLIRHLERGGYTVECERVEFAFEMRAALARQSWDIVISDYNLPRFSAPEALQQLKIAGKDIPFVVVSGDMGEEIAVAIMRDGANDYLLKHDLTRLVPAVQRELREAAERRRTNDELQLAARVFHGTRECLLVTDGQRCTISVNRAFTETCGWTLPDVQGRVPDFMERRESGDKTLEEAWHEALRDGFWQGEVWYRSKTGDWQPHWLSISAVRDAEGSVSHLVCSSSDVSAYKRAEQRIQYLAHYDVLTGLPNRILFQERIEQAIASARRYNDVLAVMFVDVDRFKTINDTLGHQVGDRLLSAVANRLATATRSNDTVARLGGDEFVIILTRTSVEGATQTAEKILRSLEEPIRLDANVLSASASIGIAVFPDDGGDVETLLKHADSALYHAKETGRNRFQFFTADLNRRAFELVHWQSAMRQALERNEFFLHYQPRIDIASGAVIGCEALLRWEHPTLGLITPDRFVWVAEDTGLIEPIGEWALRESCFQNARWQAEGLPHIAMAANVSALQFRNRGFVETVQKALRDAKLDAKWLELELTEGILMQDIQAGVRTMCALNELGVLQAIDDFGTGYSSLAYLKKLPIAHLKIDRSFVAGCPMDEHDSTIVKAVIGLAHSLRLQVIAEGVEHKDQLDFLRTHHCDSFQGYLGSKPLGANDFADLLRENARLARVRRYHRELAAAV